MIEKNQLQKVKTKKIKSRPVLLMATLKNKSNNPVNKSNLKIQKTKIRIKNQSHKKVAENLLQRRQFLRKYRRRKSHQSRITKVKLYSLYQRCKLLNKNILKLTFLTFNFFQKLRVWLKSKNFRNANG